MAALLSKRFLAATFSVHRGFTTAIMWNASAGLAVKADPPPVVAVPNIRRPVPVFALFMQKESKGIKAANPNLSQAELLKLASKKYAELSPDEKKRLGEEAAANLSIYNAKMAQLTEEQKDALAKVSAERRMKKQKKIEKRELKASGYPNRAPSASNFYLKEQFQNNFKKGTDNVTEFTARVMKQWTTLPEQEKIKFMQLSEAAKEKHDALVKQWKEKAYKNAAVAGAILHKAATLKMGSRKPKTTLLTKKLMEKSDKKAAAST